MKGTRYFYHLSLEVGPIVKRVHELYEELGREDVSAVQDWEKAPRENRKVDEKDKSKPEVEAKPKPGTGTTPDS